MLFLLISSSKRLRAKFNSLRKIADDDALSPEDLTIKIDPEDKNPSIILGDTVIATITSRDAKLHAVSQEVLAERALAKIKAAIIRYRQERQPDNLFKDAVLTVSATLATVWDRTAGCCRWLDLAKSSSLIRNILRNILLHLV